MNDPYEKLANAIIILACRDYRKVLRCLKEVSAPVDSMNADEKKQCSTLLMAKGEITDFFYSDWFAELTEIDPKTVLLRLDREVR